MTVREQGQHERAGQITCCPRCGYDQRGAVETWTDACPLTGTCTECGLVFVWAEVIRPEKFEPLWCVEFRRMRGFVRRAWSTYWMSFRPWRFWSELKMSNEVRWGRLAAYLVLLFLPLLFVYVAEQSAVALKARAVMQQQLLDRQVWATQNLASWTQMVQQQLDALPEGDPDRRRAQFQLRQVKAMAAAPGTITITPGWAVFEAVFQPLSGLTSGMINSPGGNRAYPAPLEIHTLVFYSFGTAPGWWEWIGRHVTALTTHTILQLSIFPGLPLAFVLLPISRRQSKVRWSHIIRITLYGLFLPLFVYGMSVVLLSGSLLGSSIQTAAVGTAYVLYTYGYWVGIMAWWMFAIRNYLKIPHAWLVAPALAGITVLLTLMGLFLFFPTLVIDV